MLAKIHLQYYTILEIFLASKHWKLYVVVACVFSILFFSLPYHKRITDELQQKPDRYLKWQQLKQHAEHPFTQIQAEPNSHQAKLTFRLTMPLLLRALQYNIVAFYLVQAFLGLIFCWFLADFFAKLLDSRVIAALLTFGIANIYAGASFFIDTLASYDPFAYIFLLLAICYRQPLYIFVLIQLAAWTDERGLVASCLVYLFWYLQIYTPKTNFIRSVLQFSPPLLAILSSIAVYLLGRFCLGYFLGLHTPLGNAGFEAFLENIKLTGLGVWTGLEGFWLLILVMFVVLYYTKEYLLLILVLSATIFISLIAVMVYDITRSIGYLYLLIPIACLILQTRISKKELYYVLLASIVISFIFPMYVIKNNITYLEPIYLRVIESIG
jgi:hypothetical protein